MRKFLVLLIALLIGAVAASAGGVGVFGSYLDAEDPGPGFGGGLKIKADIAEFFAVEARASCITQFDDWDGDDDLFLIPIEGALLLNLPLGDEVPVTIYGGGGGGYAIIPEADDVDFDDSFCYFGLAGIELGLGESAALFVEAQYRVLEVDGAETDDDVEIEFEEEIEFTGISVNAGLIFKF